jgi:hypothetical protein
MSATTSAQTYIQYTYDLNGNRQTRQLVVIQLKATKIAFPIADAAQLEEDKDELSEINEAQGISVYPNPAGEFIYVEFSGTIEDTLVEASLYDLNGTLLIYEKSQSPPLEINVSRLKDAIYILIVKKGSCTTTHKVIRGQGNY